ncbi:MAG: hypothetical protein MZW92_17195 [Comamonadaceae bacterium]|nr:hypothetical protein [Comamonadaceae bacterium]
MAAVYPITPQSHIAEHMADIIHDGRIDAEFITVESRALRHQRLRRRLGDRGPRLHGDKLPGAHADARDPAHRLGHAASHRAWPTPTAPCRARSTSGTTTATSCPSATAAGSASSRKTARRSSTCSIMAFKIAEDPEVMLPCVVNIDGFQLTHMIEPLELPSQAEVDEVPAADKPFAHAAPGQPDLHGLLRHARHLHGDHEGQGRRPWSTPRRSITKVFNEWGKQFRPEVQRRRDLQDQGRRHPHAHHGLHGRDGRDRRRRDEEGGQEGRPREASPLEALPGRGAEGRHQGVQDAHRHGPRHLLRGRRRARGHGDQVRSSTMKENAPRS